MLQYRTSQNGETLTIVDEQNGVTISGNGRTDVGVVRGNNEDHVQVWAFSPFLIGLVADGMGGAAGGEHASQIAVDAIQSGFVEAFDSIEAWQQADESIITQKMESALITANQTVLERAAEDHHLHGMGTTATMVMLHGRRAIFAHIGDSRAYWVDGSSRRINQVSKDHSFVEALVVSGHLTREQANQHPMKNVLYRALGQKPETELEIDIYTRDLKDQDRLILCSDGLPRHLEDHEIGEISLKSDEPDEITQQLIDLAKERGGEDNVSALVIILQEN